MDIIRKTLCRKGGKKFIGWLLSNVSHVDNDFGGLEDAWSKL